MRALLEQPAHFGEALGPASQNAQLAADIINGYPDPAGFAAWMGNEGLALEHIQGRMREEVAA